MELTENYGLKKPDENDFYNVEDMNENMDKIDAELKNRANKSHTHDNYANKTHTHSDYAEKTHTHDNYAEKEYTDKTYATKSEVEEIDISSKVEDTTIQDSTNAPLIYGKFKGYTEQQTYSGKNKLKVTAKDTTAYGITIKVNEDKSVTLNGTATQDFVTKIGDFNDNDDNYLLSGCPSGGSTSSYYLVASCRDENNEWKQDNIDIGSGKELSNAYAKRIIQIGVKSGVTVPNLTFYPMIREATITDATYEPFTNGASPNPDYPQEINGLAKDGAIEVKTTGKNLLSHSNENYSTEGLSITFNDDGSITFKGTTTAICGYQCDDAIDRLSVGETYILSGCRMVKIKEDGVWSYYNLVDKDFTYTVTEKTESFIPYYQWTEIGTVVNSTFYPQLEKGTEATNYEPYTETTASIPVTAPLYEGDYIEVYADGSGKLYKKFMNFNPTAIEAVAENVGAYIKLIKGYCKARSTALCNYLKLDATGQTSGFNFGGNAEGNFSHCFIKVLGLTTKEEYQSWLNERSDLEVIYELAEPTETLLTAEQVAEFKKLYTFEPVTNVLCDGEVEMRYYKANDNGETVGMLHKKTETSEKAVEDIQTKFGQLPNTYAKKSIYGDSAISMGRASGHTVGTKSVAIGNNDAIASGKYSVAIGNSANSTGENSVAIGSSAKSTATRSIAIGQFAEAKGSNSVAIGTGAIAKGVTSFALGYSTTALQHQTTLGYYNDETLATEPSGNLGANSGTAFVIGNGHPSGTIDSNAFRVTYEGKAIGKSAFASTGADYAEYFEWKDGNVENEDRVGYFVTFAEGNKIKEANEGDYILGVVSGMPCVIGNNDECWRGQYEMDDFGRFIYEKQKYIDEETGEEKECTFYKVNPNYDKTKEYTPREERPEWSAVGIVGVLSVYDDGTCQVNGYCKCADGGIATACERGFDTFRVIERVKDNIIKVVLK